MSRSKKTALFLVALFLCGIAALALLAPRRIDRELYHEVRVGISEREVLSQMGPSRLEARADREVEDFLHEGDDFNEYERQDQPDGSIFWHDGEGRLVGKAYRWSGSVGQLNVIVDSEGAVIGKRYAEWTPDAAWDEWAKDRLLAFVARLRTLLP